MRCISWDEFVGSSERLLEEALRDRTTLYVRRSAGVVIEILPATVDVDVPDCEVDSAIADQWCAAQMRRAMRADFTE